jgi:hypothetical protein
LIYCGDWEGNGNGKGVVRFGFLFFGRWEGIDGGGDGFDGKGMMEMG